MCKHHSWLHLFIDLNRILIEISFAPQFMISLYGYGQEACIKHRVHRFGNFGTKMFPSSGEFSTAISKFPNVDVSFSS